MVYNCRARYEPREERTLIRTSPELAGRTNPAFVVLLALATLVLLAGCGAGGDRGGGQAEGGSEASKGKPENPGGETAKLGTPALGPADAPVVMTEYSDYQ